MTIELKVNDEATEAGTYHCSLCGAEKQVRVGRRPGPCGKCRGSGVRWLREEPDDEPRTFRPVGSARERREPVSEVATWRPRGSGRSRVREETGGSTAGKRGPVFVEEEAD